MDAPSSPQTSEASTPPRAESGAEPDLAALLDRFRGPLIGLLRAWGAADPSDLAADAFAEAWLGRARFRGDWGDERAVGPWLRGIAWNLKLAAERRRGRPLRALESEPEPAAPTDDGAPRRAEVRAAIDRLPGELRTAVLMHYLERTPVRDVAALLSVTEKTIEGRLYRARKELARLLSSDEERQVAR